MGHDTEAEKGVPVLAGRLRLFKEPVRQNKQEWEVTKYGKLCSTEGQNTGIGRAREEP